MTGSVINNESNRVGVVVDGSQASMPTLANSALTYDTQIEDSVLSDNQKKRKMENIYSSGRWKEVDEYEVMKVRKVIRNHIFKHVKFCKGEGIKSSTNEMEKKSKKILLFGKSHEKADLTKKHGYEYQIMRLSGYDEDNWSITDRTLWWKTYNDHAIDEVRQLRGRMSGGLKGSFLQGKYLNLKIFYDYIITNIIVDRFINRKSTNQCRITPKN